ncbi:transposase IS66 family protein, partial [Bacteroides ovatus str. 3725 D9 iii]
NEWNAVVDIFNYGDTYLDNNMVERMNRYISLSRKNSLFFGSHKGAERGAILYTIALTCRMHKVNLFEYLTDVINRTAEWQPNTPIEKYRELLPDRWEKAND